MSAVVTRPLPAGGLRARTRHTPPPQHSSTTSTLRRTDSQRLGEDRRGHRDPLSTTATITLSVRYTWDPAARWGGGACPARHSPCALLTLAPQARFLLVASAAAQCHTVPCSCQLTSLQISRRIKKD